MASEECPVDISETARERQSVVLARGLDWGAPQVVLTVLAHAFVLFAMRHRIVVALARYCGRGPLNVPFASIIAGTVLVITMLHASEAALWAVVYVMLGALPNYKSAMLYSLEAMIPYGHAEIGLKAQWRMMGAVEALNGLVLFGLMTAFLFSIIQAAVQMREKAGIEYSDEGKNSTASPNE